MITDAHTRRLITATHSFRKKAKIVDWARRELELAGLFDKDSDYAGALGPQVLGLVELFAEQGHSGCSAGMVRSLLDKLLNWEPLTPVKDPMTEGCNDVSEMWGDGKIHYQCTRDSSIFSDDGGESWYKLVEDIHEDENGDSYADYRKVPLGDFNNGKGLPVDYRTKTAKVLARYQKLEETMAKAGSEQVRLASAKDEAFKIMLEVMEAIEKKLGRDELKNTLETEGLSGIKGVQNTLVYAMSDLAADIRMGAEFGKPTTNFERGPGGRLGLHGLSMSPETAEWWHDQRDAVHYTIARRVLEKAARDLGVQFSRSQTIYASEVLSRYEKGKPADPTENMSPEDAKRWKDMNEEHRDKFKTATTSEEKVLSRFEEGKPADPTENMSPEDAKKWKEEHEKHKNQFKEAANILTKMQVQRIMRDNNIPGEVKGAGKNWEVEVPDEKTQKLFSKLVPGVGGYKTGYGAWVLSPGYQSKGDPMDPSSRWHYASDRFETAGEDILSRFEEGKPADPTENMSPEDAKKWKEEHEKHKDQFKTAENVVSRFLATNTPRLKMAGFSVGVGRMSVIFVPARKPVPFNIDTIREINRTTIPVLADDGKVHDVELKIIGHQGSGFLTYPQEKAGLRTETRVDIQYPLDEEGDPDSSERATLVALAKMGKKFGFKVEPSRPGYRPQIRKM